MITASLSDSRLESWAPRPDSLESALVLLAMTLVTLALCLGLHFQFGLSAWLAIVIALSLYGALVSAHVLFWRSEVAADLSDMVGRLEGELAVWKREAAIAFAHEPRPPANQSRARPPMVPTERKAPSEGVQWGAPGFSAPPPKLHVGHSAIGAATLAPLAGPPVLDRFRPSNGDVASPSRETGQTPSYDPDDNLAAPAVNGTPSVPVGGPPTHAPAAPARSNEAMSRVADGRRGGSAPETPSAPMPATVSAADVEHIHAVIRKLAEELRAAKPGPAPVGFDSVPSSISDSETAFAAPVQVLKMAAETMRAMVALPAAAGGPAGPLDESATCPTDARLQEITDAVAAERLDVYIEPILGLSDLRARHYEVSFRLRTPTGGSMRSDEYTAVARGTGLLPLIDALSISRSARVAVSLNERGAAGSLFSQISGESLASNQFLREFADTYHRSETIAERFVLSFAQNDVRCFAAPQWAMLNELADLGFRFALDDVSDLDMDFETLSAAGFAFAKLDASVFLEGMPAHDGVIPAADLCRHLAGLGLTLIVGRITDDTQLAKVLGFGAVFGQGMLFGAPRAVKGEIIRHPRGVAA
jgi:cyclic-di-GMP phosphodiesterase, flagellum assembly factor TipF